MTEGEAIFWIVFFSVNLVLILVACLLRGTAISAHRQEKK